MDFSWGFHLCYINEKSCHRWYFGTDQWISMPDLLVPHAEIRDALQINGTWWMLGGFWQPQEPNRVNCGSRQDKDDIQLSKKS